MYKVLVDEGKMTCGATMYWTTVLMNCVSTFCILYRTVFSLLESPLPFTVTVTLALSPVPKVLLATHV